MLMFVEVVYSMTFPWSSRMTTPCRVEYSTDNSSCQSVCWINRNMFLVGCIVACSLCLMFNACFYLCPCTKNALFVLNDTGISFVPASETLWILVGVVCPRNILPRRVLYMKVGANELLLLEFFSPSGERLLEC